MSKADRDDQSWGITKKITSLTGLLIAVAGLIAAINALWPAIEQWGVDIGALSSRKPVATVTWSKAFGGPGGDAFEPIECREGEVMIGLYGRAIAAGVGPFVFSIAPVCAAARFDRKGELVSVASDAPHKLPQVGNGQGEMFDLTCPARMTVIGSNLATGSFPTQFGGKDTGIQRFLVAPLVLNCASSVRDTDARTTSSVNAAGDPQPVATREPFICPDRTAAFGIKGHAGNFIDSLVIGCRGG